MHPRVSEVLTYLHTNRAALERTVAAVPSELRERRPAPDRWSVAEVLQHLTLSEAQITRLLTTNVSKARAAGLGPEHGTSPVLPTVDLARVLDRTHPIVAGSELQPREDLDATAAAKRLARQREELRALVLSADGLALADVMVPNGVLGPINVYQCVAFVGGHEARHIAQIREIAAALEGAKVEQAQ